ncbi:hypothetical protein Aduo_002800 [Ancylostoma duodenale]
MIGRYKALHALQQFALRICRLLSPTVGTLSGHQLLVSVVCCCSASNTCAYETTDASAAQNKALLTDVVVTANLLPIVHNNVKSQAFLSTCPWDTVHLLFQLVKTCAYQRRTISIVREWMEVDNSLNSTFIGNWTRQQVVTVVSFVYVVVSILMVVLWSAYLCFDGRREPKKRDTLVIHKLAERTLIRAIPSQITDP